MRMAWAAASRKIIRSSVGRARFFSAEAFWALSQAEEALWRRNARDEPKMAYPSPIIRWVVDRS